MNTQDLDRAHILAVCQSAAPTTALTDAALTSSASPAYVDQLTLAYPDRNQRDQADRALTRTGYATETGHVDDARPYEVRVTGWSTDHLERRAARLLAAVTQLDTDTWLQQSAAAAIDAAARQPADADPATASYAIATDVTAQIVSLVTREVGLLVPPDRLPDDPQMAEDVRAVHRTADWVASVIGDHFNIAFITAATYIDTRRQLAESTADKGSDKAEDSPENQAVQNTAVQNTAVQNTAESAANQAPETAGEADQLARRKAWNEGQAYIANPVDANAFVEAALWAHDRHPDDAGAFALDYARDCHGTHPDDWPTVPAAYQAWSSQPWFKQPESAPQIAAADFPQPADTATTAQAEPGPAQTPPAPQQTRAPKGPR